MNFLLDRSIQTILFFGGLIGLYVLVVSLRYQFIKNRRLRSPFVEYLLRLPGHTERQQRDELFDQLSEKYDLFLLSGLLLLISAFYLNSTPGLFGFILGILGVGFSLYQSVGLHTKLHIANLRCDGEEYTGQELNYLYIAGAHVFHDIPTETGNIDHIVVANDKILVIENFIASKSEAAESSSVNFDGTSLHFPGFETTEPIEIVNQHAEFIRKRITDYCKFDYQVMPVVAIPGWHINITKRQRAKILVINPKRGTGLKAWLGVPGKSKAREIVLNYLSSVARSIPPRSGRSDSNADRKYEFWFSPRYKDRILDD